MTMFAFFAYLKQMRIAFCGSLEEKVFAWISLKANSIATSQSLTMQIFDQLHQLTFNLIQFPR